MLLKEKEVKYKKIINTTQENQNTNTFDFDTYDQFLVIQNMFEPGNMFMKMPEAGVKQLFKRN